MASSIVTRRRALVHALAALLSSLALSCASTGAERSHGALQLALTSESGGVTYRLDHAQFTLEGPETRELSAGGEEQLTLELTAGAYRLTLLPGYSLTRADDPASAPIGAKLVSQNPVPILVSAGQIARATLRFELAEGTEVVVGTGTLHVDIAIGPADAGSGASECARALRINELDYEQASSDESEFIEVLNTGSCAAPLEGLSLELVNGNDAQPYASYALAEAGPSLGAGERLVLGDPSVLALLPPEQMQAMLNGSGLQNGPDGVRIVQNGALIDAVAYGDQVAGSTEGGATMADQGELALARCPDGFDVGDGTLDFALAPPTPGLENACADAQNKSATMPSSRSQR